MVTKWEPEGHDWEQGGNKAGTKNLKLEQEWKESAKSGTMEQSGNKVGTRT